MGEEEKGEEEVETANMWDRLLIESGRAHVLFAMACSKGLAVKAISYLAVQQTKNG